MSDSVPMTRATENVVDEELADAFARLNPELARRAGEMALEYQALRLENNQLKAELARMGEDIDGPRGWQFYAIQDEERIAELELRLLNLCEDVTQARRMVRNALDALDETNEDDTSIIWLRSVLDVLPEVTPDPKGSGR